MTFAALATVPSSLTAGLQVLAVAGLVAAAGYTWYHDRDEPSARAFLALVVVVALLAVAYAVATTLGRYNAAPWSGYLTVGQAASGVAWFVFAVRYTDRRGVLTRRRLALVAVPVVVLVLLPVIESALVQLLAGLSLVFVLFMGGVGVFLVLRLSVTSGRMGVGQPVAVVLGGFTPFFVGFFDSLIADTLSAALVSVSEADVFLTGLLASALGFWLAVGHYRLFSFVPSVAYIGRDQVVDGMREGVIVADRDDRVIDLNPAVKDAYGVTSAAVGQPVSSVVGADVADAAGEEPVEVRTPDGQRRFEASVSPVTEGGREIGRAYVLRDVTGRETREQRLQVLNRVLRHNLRNDLNVVTGSASAIQSRTGDGEVSDLAETIERTGWELIETSRKARRLDDVLDRERRREPVDLDEVLERVAADLREDWPDGTVVVEGASGLRVESDPALLAAALDAAVENGLEHNDADDPTVRLSATAEDDAAVVRVRDNGPGIPSHERRTIERGSETRLEHGSGLGLWLIAWCVRRVGGEVSFEVDDGTTVVIRLPSRAP